MCWAKVYGETAEFWFLPPLEGVPFSVVRIDRSIDVASIVLVTLYPSLAKEGAR